MNRVFFLRMAAIFSSAILFASCDKEEQTVDPAADLVQTCWQGTLSKAGETHDFVVFFETATDGSYEAEEDSSKNFWYKQDKRIIDINGYPIDIMINGKWWIDQRTPTEMRLLAYPMASDYLDNTIILQRVYDN